jgi:ribosomal protein L16
MKDHDRRVSAKQLSIGAETIKKRLRGERYKLYTRLCANIGVYTHGNEVRMGKGKGSFDYFAARVAVSKIIFEIKGEMHEKVVRDALRLAAAKMPGKSLLSIRGSSLTLLRTIRIRKEGRPTSHGCHEGYRWYHVGGYETTKNACSLVGIDGRQTPGEYVTNNISNCRSINVEYSSW